MIGRYNKEKDRDITEIEKERERLSRERCEWVKETHMGEIDGLTIQWFMENNLKTIKMASILRTVWQPTNWFAFGCLLCLLSMYIYIYLYSFHRLFSLHPSIVHVCQLCAFSVVFSQNMDRCNENIFGIGQSIQLINVNTINNIENVTSPTWSKWMCWYVGMVMRSSSTTFVDWIVICHEKTNCFFPQHISVLFC